MAWNQPNKTASGGGRASLSEARSEGRSKKSSPALLRGLIAAFLVTCGGVLAWLLLSGGPRPVDEPSVPKRTARPVLAPQPKPAATAQVEQVATPAPTNKVRRGVSRYQTQQMRTLADGTKVPIRSKMFFSNGVERAFSILCNPGGMVIPLSTALRRYSDEEIMRIINTPMTYNKNDPEDLMMRKMQIQQLKDEVKDFLKEGRSLKDAIAEIDKTIRRDSSYLMMMRKSLTDALRTQDGEVVRAYVKKLNEKLEARGMRKLEVPMQYRLDNAGEAAQSEISNEGNNQDENN